MDTTYRPWETKTIDRLTQAELVHWVNWYTTGRTGPVTFDPEMVVHNVLLWERERVSIRAKIFDALLSRVPDGCKMDESDQEAVETAINDLLSRGWDQHEVVRYLRWSEHVNPVVGEDVALANMKSVKDEVEKRIQKM